MLVHTWAAVQTKHVISLVLETVATSHWFTPPVCVFLSLAPSPPHDFSFLLLYQNTERKPFKKGRVFLSPFENAVHRGGQSMIPEVWGSSHTASALGSRESWMLALSLRFLLFSQCGPTVHRMVPSIFRHGFLSSTQSGNPLPDLLTGLFRQFQMLSVDCINHCSPHIKGDFSLLFLGLGGRWVFSVHASFSPWGAILAVSFVNLFLYIPYPLHWLQGMCLSWLMDKTAPFSPPSNSTS